jgi:hypothetical protein
MKKVWAAPQPYLQKPAKASNKVLSMLYFRCLDFRTFLPEARERVMAVGRRLSDLYDTTAWAS